MPTPPTNSTDSNQLLTEHDLAQRWQISVKTLRNARVKGDLVEFVHIGRLVRYRLACVLAYEASRTVNSTSEGTS
jgi:hypothetical protein